MIFKSAGQAINPSIVGYRSLGFGEDTTFETVEFELTTNTQELAMDFFRRADSFIAQCKIDDEQQGYADIQGLKELCYPNFSNLIKNAPDLAASLIKDYLYFDLLDSLFPTSKNLKIVINNIKNIKIIDSNLVINGETFPYLNM
ncbi:hypothetical protein PMI36_03920 [Pseudomonas sp. GM79]|uniref:hypothetical protein n=1 Tax=Pseudomonas sp. GM79 TaxID=1144338 RepID=UPI00026F96CD|nr:hypothetical protein [Pseudomonas sp. GM79]EJN20856.1 hypothetical protein PMI36_03920 [Pseudomonas sp. GM79]